MTYDPRTCRQIQDAELARHDKAVEDLFSVVTLLASDIYTLRERVAALEAQHETRIDAIPAHTATPNQTYTWLPGDAWSQYCAAVDGDDDPDPMEDV